MKGLFFAVIGFCFSQLARGQGGISMKLKLHEFTNPNLSVIIDGKKYSCRYETADLDENCIVYFTLLITDLSGKIYFTSYAMQWKDEQHQLNTDDGTFHFGNSSYWWGREIDFNFENKPQEMIFIVYDIGNLVSESGARLEQGAALMDYFVKNMTSLLPDTTYNDPLSGTIQADNRLDLTYNIECDQEVYGPQCDLKDCKEIDGSPSEKYCRSQLSGQSSICSFEPNIHMGMAISNDKNCTACPNGLSAEECLSFVQGGDTGDLFLKTEELARKYRMATIVLGVFLGLLLIVLIALILCCTVFGCGKKKKTYRTSNIAYASRSAMVGGSASKNRSHKDKADPLLSDPNKDRTRIDSRPSPAARTSLEGSGSGNRFSSPKASPNQSFQSSTSGRPSADYTAARGTSRSIYV